MLKDAVLKAAETAGGGEPHGLVSYLVEQAKQNPASFMTLLGKVLPAQISGENETINVTIRQLVQDHHED